MYIYTYIYIYTYTYEENSFQLINDSVNMEEDSITLDDWDDPTTTTEKNGRLARASRG